MNDLEREIRKYKAAILLDRLLRPQTRKNIALLYDLLLFVLLGFGVYALSHFDTLLYLGFFFVALGIYLVATLFFFYYQSLSFRGVGMVMHDGSEKDSGITFEVAAMLCNGFDNLTAAFLFSPFGRTLCARLGIEGSAIDFSIESAESVLTRASLVPSSHHFITMEDVGALILREDKTFSQFLFTRGILPKTYTAALRFASRIEREAKQKRRWWSRDNLAKVRGLGADFSYGIAYELQQYLRPLDQTGLFNALSEDKGYARTELEKVETIIARARGANALLVGDTEVGVMDVILELQAAIAAGESLGSVSGKNIVVFDTESFVATHDSKQEFELAFLRMFFSAARAGNLIVVFENLPQFLSSVESLGVDAGDLMERFLSSPELHVIATTTPGAYHEKLEPRSHLLSRFSVVHIETPGQEAVVRVLEDVALAYERPGEVRFTYPALEAIAESADRYIVEGVLPDKAVDLLVELVPSAGEQGILTIDKEFVIDYVSKKTGIPAGPVQAKERDLLMHLEEVLHERVIGQEPAITMIASAMRRARSGIESKERPMGSFLFLGPTGVGKTETAKALARIFFNDEGRMSRLDMSEFSDTTSLARLIGEDTNPGILANMLKEHPYGVLLLDEFEKASLDVRNLFLQVLDEGVFTDARGAKVNARNSIIIATSNAGSSLIFDIVGQGGDLVSEKEDIVDAVVHTGVYTPELLNRFDGVILFSPLNADEQKKIALIMLEELRGRIKEKGYDLAFDDSLLSFLVEKGYDAQFGARPMRRLIQDVVEEKIAEKIIGGSLTQGATIRFTAADVSEVEHVQGV